MEEIYNYNYSKYKQKICKYSSAIFNDKYLFILFKNK